MSTSVIKCREPECRHAAVKLYPMVELRCTKCRSLLLKARFSPGSWVQVKCRSCGEMVERDGGIIP